MPPRALCLFPLARPFMIVLGIDPGTRTAGFGVIEVEGRTERALDFGTIDLPDGMDHTLRLRAIYDRIVALGDQHLPDEVAVDSGALDASDALAVALCHARRATSGAASGAPKDWAAFIKANPGRVR